jgi:hypothetical protein
MNAEVAVRIRAGEGLVIRTGPFVAVSRLDHESLHTLLDTMHAISSAGAPDPTGELLAMCRRVQVGAGGVAVVSLGADPLLVVLGAIECAIVTAAGTQSIQGGSAAQAIVLPTDIQRLGLAAGSGLPAPATHSDLRDGAVPAGGAIIEWDVALDDHGMPVMPDETPVPAAPPPPPPAPVADAPNAWPPAFTSISLRAPADEPPEPPREPLPVAVRDAAPPPPAPDVAMVRGIGCALGHVNRLDALYCAACGRRIQGTVNLIHGPRPILGLLVFEDGSTYSLDDDYVIGREPQIDPKVISGDARPMVLDDPERAISRVHADIVLDEWDVKVLDRGSANGSFVLPPGAAQWQRVPADGGVVLTDGSRVAVGRRVFSFEQR